MPTLNETLDDIIRRLDENVVVVHGIRIDTDAAQGRADQAIYDIVQTRINVRGYTDTRIQEVYDYILQTLTTWAEGIVGDANDYADGVGNGVRDDVLGDIGEWREWIDQNVADILRDAAILDQFARDTWEVEIPRILALVDDWVEETRQLEQEVQNQVGLLKTESDEMAARWRQMADDIEDAKARILEFDFSLYEVSNTLHQQVSAEFDGRFSTYDNLITTAAGELGAVATKVETLEVTVGDQSASIQNLEIALIEGDEQLAQQIQSLSVGTNTQFDPFQIWHFDTAAEGWSGSWVNGYVRTGISTQSPVMSVDANRYRQVRARIRRIGNPTWDASLSWTGATPAGPITIQEPNWAGDGSAAMGEITVNPEWSGTLTRMTLTLGPSVDAENYWLLDWITVGRPAPGASSADITTERSARISADGAMAGRIEVLETNFNTLEGDLSAQANIIDGINSSINTIDGGLAVINDAVTIMDAAINDPETGLTATSSAIQTLTNRMETVDGEISAVNSRIDNMEINVDDVIQSTAFQALVTRVETNEGNISTSGSAITNLTGTVNSLPGSISAAQAAADAAATLAGSKGRVFVQNAAPTGADRDVKNLWIDTTGGNNTPKRWISGAWEPVTDKVARDAAQAAADALAGLGDKADASALQALTQRVDDVDGLMSAAAENITSLTTGITTLGTETAAAQTAAQAASDLAGGKGRVFFQTGAPPISARQPQNLWINTSGGNNTPMRWSGTAWVAVTDKAATDALAAANAANLALASKADASALNALTTRVAETETGLTSTGRSITTLTNSVDAADTKAVNAQTAAEAAATAAGNKGKVIFRSSAPVAADRLTQNLWIDTTGGNNTPKRWNGTAWVIVQDKAATDALAAANAATLGLAAKADASAVTALDNRVTQQAGVISSTSNAVTTLTNRINHSSSGLSALASGISSLNNSVNSINGSLSALSQSITGVETRVNTASASGQIRMRSIAGPHGANTRIAIVANTSAGDNSQQAAIFLDANTNGTNDVVIMASSFAFVDDSRAGRPRTVPFFIRGGITYIKSAVIEDLSVGTVKLGNNSVTGQWAVNGSALNVTLPRDAKVIIVAKGNVENRNTQNDTGSTIYLQLRSGGSVIESSGAFLYPGHGATIPIVFSIGLSAGTHRLTLTGGIAPFRIVVFAAYK